MMSRTPLPPQVFHVYINSTWVCKCDRLARPLFVKFEIVSAMRLFFGFGSYDRFSVTRASSPIPRREGTIPTQNTRQSPNLQNKRKEINTSRVPVVASYFARPDLLCLDCVPALRSGLVKTEGTLLAHKI